MTRAPTPSRGRPRGRRVPSPSFVPYLREVSGGAEGSPRGTPPSAHGRHPPPEIDRDPLWVDKTNYFTVEVFGAQARACAQYLAKGSRVFVEAEPDWREWTDQQGNRREAVTFKARHVLFESSRREVNRDDNSAHEPTRAPASEPVAVNEPAVGEPSAAQAAGNTAGSATADDLPF